MLDAPVKKTPAMQPVDEPQATGPQTGRRALVTFTYPHHASASGYLQVAPYLGGSYELSSTWRFLGDTLLRIPAKLTSQFCGITDYSRHSFTMEAALASHMWTNKLPIVHMLYGEKFFLWSGYVRPRRSTVLATFHYPPDQFRRMVRRTGHYRRLDHAVAISSNQVEFLESLVGPGKVSVVLHGIDTAYWQPAAERPDNSTFRCLFLGEHLRDQESLVKVIEKVLPARSNVQFDIVCRNRPQGLSENGDRVLWHQRLTDDEYLSMVQQADLLVLPLKESTAVNSVLEALACGVPVLTTTGGIDDYLNEDCAVITPAEAVDDMVETIVDLVDHPERQRQMGAAARTRAEELDWSEIAKDLDRLYRRFESS